MKFNKLTPKQSLNKAYLKEKLTRSVMEEFKQNFCAFLDQTNIHRNDEEHLKAHVINLLRDAWYKDYQVSPVGKTDLVIHTGKTATAPVGVIAEVKSITNKSEMIDFDKTNAKAFHELVLYYFHERIDNNNNEVKFLIATNINDWFIFDANEFDKKIYRNSAIRKLYELKKSDNKDNPFFYEQLKQILNGQVDLSLDVTYFNVRDYERFARNADRSDDNKLIALYKLLSPVNLLKLPFANDSDSLQPRFYSELLHIIGLTEVKEGSKKLIRRKKKEDRNSGSLLENVIIQLDSHDKLSRIDKVSQYQLVYQLYCLTEEEIKIVEGEV